MNDDDPHAGQLLRTAGPPLDSARAAVVLVHGRGTGAAGILPLLEVLPLDGVAWLAPEAAGGTWYPHRFIAPIEENEPWLTSALKRVAALADEIVGAGIPAERTALVGFSQGACLALEFAARNARRWGAVAALSGGLIGPPGTRFGYPGSLEGTPVLLGCSDIDDHIPLERVHETATALRTLGAEVDEQIYPGMGHTVNDDEIARLFAMLERLAG